MKHIHHIIPKYRGGSDDPNNLIEVTVQEHALWHWCNWQLWGDDRDKIAWRMLSKRDTDIEQARIGAIKAQIGTKEIKERQRNNSIKRWKNEEERKKQSERISKTWDERRKKRRFSPEDVAVIRSEKYNLDELSQMFKCPRNTIKTVRQGVTYSDLPMGNVVIKRYKKKSK